MECLVVTILLDMEVQTADFRFQLETPHMACRCVCPAFAHRHQLCPQCELAGNCAAVITVMLGPSKNTLLLSRIYWHGLKNTLTLHKWFLVQTWEIRADTERTSLPAKILQIIPMSPIVLVYKFTHFYIKKRKETNLFLSIGITKKAPQLQVYNFLPLQTCRWNSDFREWFAVSPSSANLWATPLP